MFIFPLPISFNMTFSSVSVLGCLFAGISAVKAQISLSDVPQASCAGNAATATATFSTSMTIETGSQRIPAGDFWEQMGAVWVFSTDSEGIEFSGLGIPGAGAEPDIPQMDIDALVLDDSKTAWTLNVPTASGANEFDIVFQAATPTSAGSSIAVPSTTSAPISTTASSVSGAISAGQSITTTTTPTSVPARFRKRQPSRAQLAPRASATGGTFNLIISGTYPCNLNPSIGLVPGPTVTGGNPTVAAQCSKNSISTNKAAWTAYAGNKYMSSMLSAAAPAPTAPQVDAASLFGHDVGAQDFCTYSSKCDAIQCGDIADASTGANLVIQRYLTYTSLVNFNNYLYAIYEALYDSGTIGIAGTGELVKTFFTNPDPPVTWQQILSVLGPLLGIFSAAAGGVGAAAASAVSGVVSGIVGVVASVGNTDTKPVADKRFDELGTIDEFIKEFLQATANGVEAAYEQFIGNASSVTWSGSDLVSEDDPNHNGIFGEGDWVDANNFNTANMQKTMLDNFVRIISYKSINYAWNDSNAFIMYVPYNTPIKNADGKMDSIDEDYCTSNLQKSDDDKILTICNAPGPGMARLFSADSDDSDTGNNLEAPKGYNVHYEVIPGETFFTSAATHGSVASWIAGDFDYDLSKSFEGLTTGTTLSSDDVTKLTTLSISPETAGFFNIPVCRILDLRAFPPAGGKTCGCNDAAAVGGMPGSTAKFSDNVSKDVMDWLSQKTQAVCISIPGPAGTPPSCSNTGGCPKDLYTG